MRKRKNTTLAVKIDSHLAVAFEAVYARTIRQKGRKREPLAKFIAGFVEDRLVEEITFLDGEATHGY
jgi:hypothetical protein